jgi:RNA polymerase sigma-70 factor (ECF subfamily)
VPGSGHDVTQGLQALREAVACALFGNFSEPQVALAVVDTSRRAPASPYPLGWLLSETVANSLAKDSAGHGSHGSKQGFGDSDQAASSEETEEERSRLIALVELARTGDSDAFGMLYDHYQGSVYRFLFYRTRSSTLAEDLTSETFFRALRNMQNFRWQGKDFGAWLMTIARNLATDHFKAGRTRLELSTEDMGLHDDETEGPEHSVLASLTNDLLLKALTELPSEQKDCLIMRFLQGMSIAETAAVLGRSEGAVKQLQLRGVRNLAKLMPEGIR